MYSIFICVKRLRNSASSTLGSLGASVILRGIPEVWKRNAVEDIAGLTGMRVGRDGSLRTPLFQKTSKPTLSWSQSRQWGWVV